MDESPQRPAVTASPFWTKAFHPRLYQLLVTQIEPEIPEWCDEHQAQPTEAFIGSCLDRLCRWANTDERFYRFYSTVLGRGFPSASKSPEREEIFRQFADFLLWCPQCDGDGQIPGVWYFMRDESAWEEHRGKHSRQREGYTSIVNLLTMAIPYHTPHRQQE